MKSTTAIKWYIMAGCIGLAFGIFYAFFGLEGLPVYRNLIPGASLEPWKNGLYGSMFIAFSVLLLFVGRHAFEKNDKRLMRILLYGISAWLLVEAFFSVLHGAYFNVGVDVVIFAALGYPLFKGIRPNQT